MGRDQDKLIRQLSLLSFLLSRPRPFSVREIRDSVEGYWGMSDDTFARRFYGDRADLQKIGIEIRALGEAESADTQMYCLFEEDYRLPSLDFTPDERRALALVLATLEGRFAYARPLRLALTAISRGEPDPLRDELEQLPVALAPDEDAMHAGRQLARLEQAAARGKTVCFSYPSSDGSMEERTFDPYSLFLIQGRWYAVGFDHRRQAIRTFRVARIEGTVRYLTEKTRDFTVPADYDPSRYRARPPWLIGPVRGTATIRVDEDLSWWVERLQPHVRSLGMDREGCSVFEAPYADEDVLLSWVVGLGGCGELLEPDDLRQSLRRRLEEVHRLHSGPGLPPPVCTTGSTMPDRGPHESRGVQRAAEPISERAAEPIAPEHLARTLALLRYLVAERETALVTWEALRADLELSRAEVEADLTLLNLMNFGGGTYTLWAEAGDAGVTVTPDVMADAFVHPARLSPLMARALLLAVDMVGEAIALEGAESLASVRKKVEMLVGSAGQDSPVLVDDVMAPDHDVMSVINSGIRHRHLVEIEYFSPSREELSTRIIEPYLLFRSRDGWYVEAYCRKAGGQRTFNMQLVRAARTAEEPFTPRPDVDLSQRRAGMAFSPSSADAWASMRFTPRWTAYLKDRGLSFEVLADGSLATRVPYLDERWMARETVRFLGGAVLDAPESVRAQVAALAATLLERYERCPDVRTGRQEP